MIRKTHEAITYRGEGKKSKKALSWTNYCTQLYVMFFLNYGILLFSWFSKRLVLSLVGVELAVANIQPRIL